MTIDRVTVRPGTVTAYQAMFRTRVMTMERVITVRICTVTAYHVTIWSCIVTTDWVTVRFSPKMNSDGAVTV
jgi:hypothetical protein